MIKRKRLNPSNNLIEKVNTEMCFKKILGALKKKEKIH
jgi:hypothetical protein